MPKAKVKAKTEEKKVGKKIASKNFKHVQCRIFSHFYDILHVNEQVHHSVQFT